MADKQKVWLILSIAVAIVAVGALVLSVYAPAREALFGKALAFQQPSSTTLVAKLPTLISACGPTNIAGTTYQLAQDIVASTSCFNDFADGVILDCAGHKITGTLLPDGSLAGHGVSVNGKKGVTIKNCVVSKFFSGIIVENAVSSTLSNNDAYGNRFGIVVSTGSSVTVSSNRACENNGQDFRCAQDNTISASGTGNTFSTVFICPYILWPQVNANYVDCVDELFCTNNLDDDGDTRPDCLDYDCAAEPACSVLQSCTSATAATDCPSAQCADTTKAPGKAFSSYCYFESYCALVDVRAFPEACDGKDNDCDGQTDEGLVDCFTAVAQPIDSDGDGVVDADDNCPLVANAGQANVDGDTLGDACDTETCDGRDNDGDTEIDERGVCRTRDNCGSFGTVCGLETEDCIAFGVEGYQCSTLNADLRCADTLDNDNDGQSDCADADCSANAACASVCGNKVIEGGEVCDGNSQNCILPDKTSGRQSCLADCSGWGTCSALLVPKTTGPIQIVSGPVLLPADADSDGVPDASDLCPGTLSTQVVEPATGCPFGDANQDGTVTVTELTEEYLRAQWVALNRNLIAFNQFIQNVRTNMGGSPS